MVDPRDKLSEHIEQVRAYLVSVRGGAPFLSAADGRLLIEWLEGGVSVSAITSAVDRAAQRRREKRPRSRLTLSACRSELKKVRASAPEAPGSRADLLALAEEFAAIEEQLGRELARAARTSSSDAEAADRAIDAVRAFQERRWQAADQAALLARASEQVAHLRESTAAGLFELIVEEAARDLVRQLQPRVCARVVWDTLGL